MLTSEIGFLVSMKTINNRGESFFMRLISNAKVTVHLRMFSTFAEYNYRNVTVHTLLATLRSLFRDTKHIF